MSHTIDLRPMGVKVRLPRYTLDELLKGCDADHRLSTEEKAWAYAPPVGNEVC